MDARTLVIGQDVYMASGVYGGKGKVVKVTPWGVEVKSTGAELLRFDINGKPCDSEGKPYDAYRKPCMDMYWRGIPGTPEGGPWELIDDSKTGTAGTDPV